MRTEEEISASAREGSPFSNGTEGYAWMSNWCDRCTNNDEETEKWCPLLTVALLGQTPAEWLEQEWGVIESGPHAGTRAPSLYDRYHCIEFHDKDGPGDAEPRPVPDPPDQLVLLPREPYEGVRMFTALPSRAEVNA